jgi:hypothetical protein
LDTCDLSNRGVLLINRQGLLINKGILVYILSSKGIIIYNLGFGHTLAYKIDSKATLTYSLSLIKWISYKAKDSIKFKGGKGFSGSNLFLDFLLSLFCRVLLT